MKRTGPAPQPPDRSLAAALAVAVALAVVGVVGVAAGAVPAAAASGPSVPAAGAVGQPAPHGSGVLDAVACGSAEDCWAVGPAPVGAPSTAPVVVDATTDGGRHWHAEQIPVAHATDFDAISCAGTRFCMAAGSTIVGTSQGAVAVSTDGGRRWRTVAGPAGAGNLSAVECAAASSCLVLADQGDGYWAAATADGGTTWQHLGALPAGTDGFTSLACATAGGQACMAAGYGAGTPGKGTGVVAVTTDGGAAWAAATVPPGTGILHAVACGGPDGDCVTAGTTSTAVDEVVQAQAATLSSGDGGTGWTADGAPGGIGDAFGVACPTATTCVEVGTQWTPTPVGAVVASGDGGTTWQPVASRYLPAGLTAVACPTATACVAAGNDVLARISLAARRRAR